MDTDELKKLLPCPFCGGDAKTSYMPSSFGEPLSADVAMALIGCSDILCARQSSYTSTAKAIAAWNTRADAPLAQRVIDLEAELARLRGNGDDMAHSVRQSLAGIKDHSNTMDSSGEQDE